MVNAKWLVTSVDKNVRNKAGRSNFHEANFFTKKMLLLLGTKKVKTSSATGCGHGKFQ